MIVTGATCFIAHFYVRPDRRAAFQDEFDALWQADVEGLKAATNFVFYGWGRDENEFVAIESWKDDEVTDAVRASDLFQEKVGALLDLCSAPMLIELFAGSAVGRAVFDRYPAGDSRLHPRAGAIGGVFA